MLPELLPEPFGGEIDRELRAAVEKYWPDKNACRFCIPFNGMSYYNDFRILGMAAMTIVTLISIDYNIDISYQIEYNNKYILFFVRNCDMKTYYTIEIPYMDRSKYFDFVYKVNRLVDLDGLVSIFANNTPSEVQCLIVVETNKNHLEIEQLIKKNHLCTTNEKGLEELLKETIEMRKWNNYLMPPHESMENIQQTFDALCLFSETAVLEQRGFVFDREHIKKKIFISYCHADKEIVFHLTDEFERSGLHMWLDKKELDAGDNILESIQKGMADCDMAVLFISKSTQNANFAKYELNRMWNYVIKSIKKWFIIKVDDVIPDDIYPGLGNYLYYDYPEDPSIENLTAAIKKKLYK